MAIMGATCSSCSNDRVIEINISNKQRANIQEDSNTQYSPMNVNPFMNFIDTGQDNCKENQSASFLSTESLNGDLNGTFSAKVENNDKMKNNIRNDKHSTGKNDFFIRYHNNCKKKLAHTLLK